MRIYLAIAFLVIHCKLGDEEEYIREEEIEGEVDPDEKKMARSKEDRLSKLTDELKVQILSFLDTPDAINTTMLSKTWVSFWSRIPVLEFNLFEYNNINNVTEKLKFFNCNRSAKLDQLTYTRGRGSDKNNIFESLSKKEKKHEVKKKLDDEASIHITSNHTWPLCLNSSYETSLTSLEVRSKNRITRPPFLGPRSGSFKNLINLCLTSAIIPDLDPFSGFPVLERLRLINCDLSTDIGIRDPGKTKTLHFHALNLSHLTISGYQNFFDCCELTTPRLIFFQLMFHKFRGCEFRITHDKGVPDLDALVINCDSYPYYKKKSFDTIFSLFCTFDNIEFLTLSDSTLKLLSSFQEELVKRNSPLHNLKWMTLNFGFDFDKHFSTSKMVADVKAYLLQNSPHAAVTMMHDL